jgi:hypothetical protein
MSSKSRGGLSKREYAAQKAGGKLNYSTGKISVPAKSTPKSTYKGDYSGSSYETGDPDMGYIASNEYQDYLNQNQGKAMPAYEFSVKNEDYNKKKSSSSPSKSSQAAEKLYTETQAKKVNTSQRSQAADSLLAGGLFGTPTANAQTTGRGASMIKQNTSGIVGDLFNTLGQSTKDLAHAFNFSVPDIGLSELLGINKNIPNPLQPEGDQPYVDWENGTVAGVYSDASQSQPYNPPRTPSQVLNLGRGPVNYPGVTDRKSQPVNPIFNPSNIGIGSMAPQYSGISSAYSPQVLGAETFNTPVTPENATVQRPVGMGQFSSGQYGNGAGGYGVEGGLTGTQQAMNNPDPFQGENDYFAALQKENPDIYSQIIDEIKNGIGGVLGSTAYAAGNNMMNYSAPTRGNLSKKEYATKYGQPYSESSDYNRSYDKQEKAQKNAWESLQKQIESQYGQDVQTGTESLNQAKQQDLQKLGGMFDFANSAPNDEQRVQYQQRTMNDYTGKLNELLSKLAASKTQAMSSGKQNYESQLSTIAQARADAQMKMQQLAQQQQQQQFENMIKLASLRKQGSTSAGSLTYLGDDGNGNPVYYNSKTGQKSTMSGITRKTNPYDSLLGLFSGLQGGQQGQGGSWEIDPQTGQQIWVTD